MGTTGNRDGSGFLVPLAAITPFSGVLFGLAPLRAVLAAAVVVAALLLVLLLMRTADRTRSVQRSGTGPVEQARRAGAEDMRTAWLRCRLGVLPPQQRAAHASFVAGLLAETPRGDWDATRLRRHGQALWSVRDAAARTSLRPEVEARLDRVAALLSDLTGEEFDPCRGQADDRYVCHPDDRVRAAYLDGGSGAVQAVVRSICAARAQARLDAAAKAAADSLARQGGAALRALRETRQPAGAGSLHADWEAQARRIGR